MPVGSWRGGRPRARNSRFRRARGSPQARKDSSSSMRPRHGRIANRHLQNGRAAAMLAGPVPHGDSMPTIKNYNGIIPAIACPFTRDHRIDEGGLRGLASWLAAQPGIVAIMTNGHTGEVFSLQPHERSEEHT